MKSFSWWRGWGFTGSYEYSWASFLLVLFLDIVFEASEIVNSFSRTSTCLIIGGGSVIISPRKVISWAFRSRSLDLTQVFWYYLTTLNHYLLLILIRQPVLIQTLTHHQHHLSIVIIVALLHIRHGCVEIALQQLMTPHQWLKRYIHFKFIIIHSSTIVVHLLVLWWWGGIVVKRLIWINPGMSL